MLGHRRVDGAQTTRVHFPTLREGARRSQAAPARRGELASERGDRGRALTRLELAYLVVTGTTTAPLAAEMVQALLELVPAVITLATPNAAQVVTPRDLAAIPGNRLVESYFDAAILPRPPDGLVLVAPCSFNSLNKLAAGIADNLALSVTAEAIGRGTPVIVAPSLNAPLLRHPRAADSIATLRDVGRRRRRPGRPGRRAAPGAERGDARRGRAPAAR